MRAAGKFIKKRQQTKRALCSFFANVRHVAESVSCRFRELRGVCVRGVAMWCSSASFGRNTMRSVVYSSPYEVHLYNEDTLTDDDG